MDIFLDPKVDFIFKKLMEDEELLVDFINRVLSKSGQKIVSAKIINPVNTKESAEDKDSILDVKAQADDGSYINIEIQRKDEKNMVKRSLFHWSKMYVSQLKKGRSYNLLEKTICINVLDFNLLQDEHYHNYYILMNPESQNSLNAPMEIHFLELKKYEKFRNLGEDDGLKDWIEFLNAPERVQFKSNPKIKKAVNKLAYLSSDGELREIYQLRLDAQLNGEIIRNTAREDGIKEGLKQGIEKAIELKLQDIQNAIGKLNDEMILSIFKISPEVLEKVKHGQKVNPSEINI